MPSGRTLMLAGFRSRCTIPCSCAASSAPAICRASASAWSSGTGPCAMRTARSSPSTSSITIARTPSPSSRPWIAAMCGWFSDASTSASRWKRASRSGSVASDVGRILTATWRLSRVSVARYTSPMPPAPSGETISYGPRRVPGVRLTTKPAGLYGRARRPGGPPAAVGDGDSLNRLDVRSTTRQPASRSSPVSASWRRRAHGGRRRPSWRRSASWIRRCARCSTNGSRSSATRRPRPTPGARSAWRSRPTASRRRRASRIGRRRRSRTRTAAGGTGWGCSPSAAATSTGRWRPSIAGSPCRPTTCRCAGVGGCSCSIAATSRPPTRRFASPSTWRPAMPASATGQARVLMARGQAADAAARLEALLERTPADRYAYQLLGTAYRQLGRAVEAGEALAAGAGGEPVWADPWSDEVGSLRRGFASSLKDATALAMAGRYPEAIALLERLQRERPADRELRTYLGGVYASAGRVAEARALLDTVLAETPGDFDATMHLATAHLFAGDYDAADRAAVRALALRPATADATRLRGVVAWRAGRLDDARRLARGRGRRRPPRRQGAGVGGDDRPRARPLRRGARRVPPRAGPRPAAGGRAGRRRGHRSGRRRATKTPRGGWPAPGGWRRATPACRSSNGARREGAREPLRRRGRWLSPSLAMALAGCRGAPAPAAATDAGPAAGSPWFADEAAARGLVFRHRSGHAARDLPPARDHGRRRGALRHGRRRRPRRAAGAERRARRDRRRPASRALPQRRRRPVRATSPPAAASTCPATAWASRPATTTATAMPTCTSPISAPTCCCGTTAGPLHRRHGGGRRGRLRLEHQRRVRRRRRRRRARSLRHPLPGLGAGARAAVLQPDRRRGLLQPEELRRADHRPAVPQHRPRHLHRRLGRRRAGHGARQRPRRRRRRRRRRRPGRRLRRQRRHAESPVDEPGRRTASSSRRCCAAWPSTRTARPRPAWACTSPTSTTTPTTTCWW